MFSNIKYTFGFEVSYQTSVFSQTRVFKCILMHFYEFFLLVCILWRFGCVFSFFIAKKIASMIKNAKDVEFKVKIIPNI